MEVQDFTMGYLPDTKLGWTLPITIDVERDDDILTAEMRRVLIVLDPDAEVPEMPIASVKGEWQGTGTVPELGEFEVSGPVVLCFHGGGYITGSAASERTATMTLAKTSGATVLAIDYRLAPQHPFPAALLDAIVAYRYLIQPPDGRHKAVEPRNIVIGGDSAGVHPLSLSLIAGWSRPGSDDF